MVKSAKKGLNMDMGEDDKSVIDGPEGGVNDKTSGNTSFHVESNWRLNEVMKGAATIELGSLFQNSTTPMEKDLFLRAKLTFRRS